ncbi:MAG: hypothetical protein JWR24_734 [Actinoallomurus sp.]|nr:hypothetical protein [Actinoallomurus sp.]
MDDERCRITVVGARRRVDLAVPARAPIAEYISTLTRLCGQETDETFPAAWSLALPGLRPISPGTSLTDAAVRDGTTLYLRDVVEGETDEPLVTDVGELVEDAGDRWPRWNARHRALAVLGVGLGALLAALAALVLGSPDSPASGLSAIVSGFGLALIAGVAVRRDWPVPAPLRLAVALAACPVLALAGYALPFARHGTGAGLVTVVVGANVGALSALLAVVDVCTLTVETLAVVALPVSVLLAALRANGVECAAVVGVAALAVLGAAPLLAGRLTALAPVRRSESAAADPADEVAVAVGRSRAVLIAYALTASVVLAACMLVLAGSADLFAVGLVLCLSLALLAQAGQSNVPAAVVPVAAAGGAGLIALAVRAPAHLLHTAQAVGPVAAWGVAVLLLCAGIAMTVRKAGGEVSRPSWIDTVGVLLSVLSVPLAVGVFGVFEYLMGVGGRL